MCKKVFKDFTRAKTAVGVVSELIRQGCSFQVDPLPFDEWRITVKDESVPRGVLEFYYADPVRNVLGKVTKC